MNLTTYRAPLLAIGIATLGLPAAALDFQGYFRALTASNSARGGATCFKLDGAMSKYRLGNECETYGEFLFSQDVPVPGDSAVFRGVVMLSVYNPNSSGGGTDVGAPQIYAQGGPLEELNGGSVWLGRRYYRREGLGPNDFIYWSGRGFGGGVEDLPLGRGATFAYAWLRKDNVAPTFAGAAPATGALADNGSNSASRHDFQVRGLPVNRDGTLELGLSLIVKDAKDKAAPAGQGLHHGYGVTLQHRQRKLAGDGWNKLALQYGAGPGTGGADPAIGAIGDLAQGRRVKRLRLVEGAYAQFTPRLGAELVAVLQRDSGHTAAETRPGVSENKTWTSLGLHLVYGMTRHFKLAANLGLDRVRPQDGATRGMTTLTIAPTLSSGAGLNARPDLRLFYTYARWNDAARAAASSASPGSPLSATGAFGAARSGGMLGLQAEACF